MIIKKRVFGVSVIWLIDEFRKYNFRKNVMYLSIGTTPKKAIRLHKILEGSPCWSQWYIPKQNVETVVDQFTKLIGAYKAMGMDAPDWKPA